MWHPSYEQIRTLQLLGGLTMALMIGGRYIPGLRRHARSFSIAAAILYVGFGLGMLVWGLLSL